MGSKKLDSDQEKKGLFLIDTNIQLLNAVNFVQARGLDGKMDAIIQMKSRNAEKTLSALRESSVFDKVYSIDLDRHTKWERLGVLTGLLFPRSYFYKLHHLDIWKKYNEIYLAFATKTFDLIIAASGCRNIVGFDDGMGSYIGNPYLDNYKKRYLFIRKLTGHDYRVETIFLNNPSCYYGDTGFHIQSILSPDKETDFELISRIFDFKYPDDLSSRRYIYLNQAITDVEDYIDREHEIAETANNITGNQLIVRMHPSERRTEIYNSMQQDHTKNMWELVCNKVIADDTVLIGFFSTAQFSPKLLADIEPYIIFTFNLIEGYPENKKRQFYEYVRFFQSKYRKKDKIFVPDNYDEYKLYLNRIVEGNRMEK